MNKYVAEHPEKRYNVIGTAALVDKMKVWYDTKNIPFYAIKYSWDFLVYWNYYIDVYLWLGQWRIIEEASWWQMGSIDSKVYKMSSGMAPYGKSEATKRCGWSGKAT